MYLFIINLKSLQNDLNVYIIEKLQNWNLGYYD